MIVTSKGFSVLLCCLLIAAFSRTGGHTVPRWEKSQRRTAKTLTVAHFQTLALD